MYNDAGLFVDSNYNNDNEIRGVYRGKKKSVFPVYICIHVQIYIRSIVKFVMLG